MSHQFKKYFGQNFLTSKNQAKRIVDSIDPEIETVLEIGPGEGALTNLLVEKFKRVKVVEIDRSLYAGLESKFGKLENFELIKQDVLTIDFSKMNLGKYAVVGSLPYNISKNIIQLFLETENKPEEMVLLIQKEVAEDYTAKPPKSSFLANYVNLFSECEYLFTIPKEQFFPRPKVDGGVIRLQIPNSKPQISKEVVKFIKAGFATPRKTLANNLKSLQLKIDKEDLLKIFESLEITEKMRPAELSTYQWINLYEKLHEDN